MNYILSHFISKNLAGHGIRKTKITALCDMTSALLSNADLTLTSLGRNLCGNSFVKHKIKRVDRWLDNEGLFEQIPLIYKTLLNQLLERVKDLVVLVDWSGCCSNQQWCLRASIAYNGRSIPIYQEIRRYDEQQKKYVHDEFLKNLKNILPTNCNVVIVTDRGFNGAWFKSVKEMGWDYIGRLNSYVYYQVNNQNWTLAKKLYSKAKNTPQYVGDSLICKTAPMQCSLYMYKDIKKNRKKSSSKGKYLIQKMEKQYKDTSSSPWLLVTSLPGGQAQARKIKNIYAKRMQIEQNFRDDKSERFGFAFRYSRSRGKKRISILYLIAAIATYVAILVGTAAENLSLQNMFQANTTKNRRVLSLVFLGKQVIQHLSWLISPSFLMHSYKLLVREMCI